MARRGTIYFEIFGALAIVLSFIAFLLSFLQVKLLGLSQDAYQLISTVMIGVAGGISSLWLQRRSKLRSKKVFMIYSHRDAPKVIEVADFLKSKGYFPFMGSQDIMPGEVISEVVSEKMRDSRIAIAFISTNFQDSPYNNTELDIAIKSLKSSRISISSVIPVKLDDSPVPDALKGVQYADLRSEDGLALLVKGLDSITNADVVMEAFVGSSRSK